MAEEEKTVSCDILQEKYAEVRAVGEAYKKALYAFGKVTAPEVQEAKKVFYSRLRELRGMLQERQEYLYEKYKPLAESTDVFVRHNAARDQNLPPALAEQLLGDRDILVRIYAAANPNLPDRAIRACIKSTDKHIRRSVAKNQSTSPELAKQLLEDKDTSVRELARRNIRRSRIRSQAISTKNK